ncbi:MULTISPECIES: AAA family ATPase [unclassified Coleofasciculus]|uniref:AAA family ATPase n=1 Tax=unclassified Coleofasciculus TaxID=2692782 RepID=UPI00187F2762|nr:MULTISPECIES: AAA family ATPase [unclassified Coleofasciculus]MBE9129492.1 AAA family ATPase [Coleofasciculus sp. LEGE 07081]MBE9148433.1 AAA family ATPase [Coleofasciculus sp. LEGE 07092]
MLTLPGYQIQSKIYESDNSLVYRGVREADNQAVILKVLKGEYPTPAELTQYKQEYAIAHSLDLEGVIKAYCLETYQNTLVIVFEDFGGDSLHLLINKQTFNLAEFLNLAIKIAEILSQIHAANIIHKGINPSNIIFNPETEQIKIIDFGISTVLRRETAALQNPNVLEGTLAYMSPEQTGRMNRLLDYRTDFYSLGATFYELLTNRLPFETTDPLELVHCHIAKQPIPPHELNSAIPKTLSDLVIKLLAKTAEERYQSAWGIQADLVLLLMQLEANGEIEDIILGENDVSDTFQIPQKLYGRDAAIATLLTAFERVSQGTREMMLVTGYSGMGKSALVQEIYKPVTRQKGYFISGKFDQLQRNTPYEALIKAFQKLVGQLLTESETQLHWWREKLTVALGANTQIIIDVIPEIELIVGTQPDAPDVTPPQSQNRFSLLFQNFIKVFAQPEHPLVIFLDDLEWADSASLKLMQLLMTAPDSPYLFLIGAYRDNEVSAAHPLMLTLDEICESGAVVNHISLSPLGLPDINQLISETLHCQTQSSHALAELVLAKTGGNPFFLQEFLQSLYAENLLTFDLDCLSWQWDLAQIQGQKITDNVVELMAQKLQKLPENTQCILKFAACIGNQFELEMLAIVSENNLQDTALILHLAVTEGIILPLSDAYKSVELKAIKGKEKLIVTYKFVHDRIQQAAYSLISDRQKQIIHRQLGQQLLQRTPPEKQSQKIFDIVNQLNFSIELINNESERVQLAQLNLIAGQKAKASAAYASAFDYLQVGIKLLGGDRWQKQYHLTLTLYEEAAEAAYLRGDFEQMTQLTDTVFKRGKTILDKVKVYEIKIQAYTVQNKLVDAVQIGQQTLKQLRVRLPKNPTTVNTLIGYLSTVLALAGKKPQDLKELPDMTDPYKLATMRILLRTASPAYFTIPKLFALIVFKCIKLSVKYSNAASAYAYATYGLILCGLIGSITTSYEFGKLALHLLDKSTNKELKARTLLIFNGFLRHWKEPLRETLTPLLDTYQTGLETGDLEYAAYAIHIYCINSYFGGRELPGVEREMAIYGSAIEQLKQTTALYSHKIYRQAVLNLLDRAENYCCLVGESYDEQKMLPLHLEANDQTAVYSLYLNKFYLCYIFQNKTQAFETLKKAQTYSHCIKATITVPVFYFYSSLTQLAVYPDVSNSLKRHLLHQVRWNQKRMKRWAHHAPINYLHKFYLVEAERYRVIGQDTNAMELYDRAITLAKENEHLNEEALAYELAANFYLSRGRYLSARTYMQEARYCYLKWGATAKVKQLDETYPQLFPSSQPSAQEFPSTPSITGINSSEVLDLATVMKASQAISSNIVLDKLLASLMKILIENAGAQFGYLILEAKGKLLIEASGSVESESITVLQSIPIEEKDNLTQPQNLPIRFSTTLINYVARTKDSVVLKNATEEGKFTNDSYIKEYKPKSILCAPLLDRGQLAGIVYLENNLTTGAFTPQRLKLLNLLSAQAAISINNARFYNNMAELNKAYERFVPRQFLQFLDKESIVDVQLGDQIQQDMSVLFSDIRDFTSLSERMTPAENFQFINSYLSRMEPAISEHHGFIDKYIGDEIMALFSGGADDAVKAAIAMLHRLTEYNQHRQKQGYIPIEIGIGINTGSLMLGTVGGQNRMDGTVISDAVNLASRLERLTKEYGVSLLISHHTLARLNDPTEYNIRLVEQVKVRGKSKAVAVFEVFNGDPPELRDVKLATVGVFEEGLLLYYRDRFSDAALRFTHCLQINPADQIAQLYLERCQQQIG